MYIGNWSDYETMMQAKHGNGLTPYRMKYCTLKRYGGSHPAPRRRVK